MRHACRSLVDFLGPALFISGLTTWQWQSSPPPARPALTCIEILPTLRRAPPTNVSLVLRVRSKALGASSLLLVATYPLMKRVTNWVRGWVAGQAGGCGTLLRRAHVPDVAGSRSPGLPAESGFQIRSR